jgi:diguanylate cyclase (GGDEF)-like protein
LAYRIVFFYPYITDLNAARLTGKLKCYLSFNGLVRTGDFAFLIGGDAGLYATGHIVKLNKDVYDDSNKMSVEFGVNQILEDLVSLDECRKDPELQEMLSSATDNFPSFSPALFNRLLAKVRLRGIDVPDDMPEFDESTDINGFRGILAFRFELKKAVEKFGLVSVLYMDLDNFKPVNDNHDYATGNLVIAEALKTVREIVGQGGELFRPHVTGDEMIGLLPNVNNSDSMQIAENIRLAVEQYAFSVIGQGIVTVTIGLVTFPETCNDWEALENTAEPLLKQAKRTERNVVNFVVVANGDRH